MASLQLPNTSVGVQDIDRAIDLLLTVVKAAERVADRRLAQIHKGDTDDGDRT